MLTPGTYGHSGNSNAAYYWLGNKNTLVGAGNLSVQAVWAGWLSGFPFSSPGAGSNLTGRDVLKYTGAARTTRFSNPSTIFAVFVGLWGKNRAVFPTFTGWQVFGTPTNAT